MSNWNQILRHSPLPGWAILPLRLFLGVTFIWASFDKLLDPAFLDPNATGYVGNQLGAGAAGSPLGGLLTAVVVPNATLFGMLVMAGELLIGLAVVLGWFTRFSALMGLLINLVFYLTITWEVRPYYYGSDIVFVFAWLTLLLTGPGPVSVDGYLRGWVASGSDQSVPAGRGQVPVRAQARTGPGGQAGRRPQAPGGADAATISRRQFNVLAFSALAGVVLGLLDIGAGSFLHRGEAGREAALPPSAPPSATATAAPPVALGPQPPVAPTSAPAPPATAPAAEATATVPPPDTAPAVPAPATTDTPVPPPAATDTPAPTGTLLAAPGQLPVGQALSFTDPATGDPGVLVHLDSGYSAYTAICTHERCEVGYYRAQRLLACPCHGSIFDPASRGAVVRGPARRPLSAIPITVGADGGVYLAG